MAYNTSTLTYFLLEKRALQTASIIETSAQILVFG